MILKRLLFPFFLLGLLLTNIKAVFVFLFYPLIKHRFFSFSFIILVIYLTYTLPSLFPNERIINIKLINNKSLETISLLNFNKLDQLESRLREIQNKSGDTTSILLNLALVSHYRNDKIEYQKYLDLAKNLDPNHPFFK